MNNWKPATAVLSMYANEAVGTEILYHCSSTAEAEKSDKLIQKDITVAEIRAAGYGAQSDVNQNMESDFSDAMKDMRQRDEYREQMNFKKEQASSENANKRAKMDIDREKLNTQREIADKNLQIARENKNKYDVKPKKKDKKK